MAVGKVFLVGAGPGDPGLITVKGQECVAMADAIVYDRLASPALVARSRPDAEKIYVGKEVGACGRKQSDINHLLGRLALEGKAVCRLKGGDPFVFGRGGEEAEHLTSLGIPYEVVPGITSGIAATAYAGIPVTHRDYAGSVALITGHDADGRRRPASDWDRLATSAETLLIYMGVETLPETCARLIALGRHPDTPVAVVSWGTRAEQRTVSGTLATVAVRARQEKITSPAMIAVGPVAALREKLQWAESLPRFGQRVLIPTSGEPVLAAAGDYRAQGAEVWEWPVAAYTDLSRPAALDEAIRRLPAYRVILFAGAPAVSRFISRLLASGRDLRDLGAIRIGADDALAAEALQRAGLRAEPVGGPGPVLVVGAEGAADAAVARLRLAGVTVHVAATHVEAPRLDTADLLQQELLSGAIHEVVFPSPAAVRHFVAVAGSAGLPAGIRVTCLTREATAAAVRAGLVPAPGTEAPAVARSGVHVPPRLAVVRV